MKVRRKIKIISTKSADGFEYSVNHFIESHRVFDIKFKPTSNEHGHVTYNAMIIYEETVE